MSYHKPKPTHIKCILVQMSKIAVIRPQVSHAIREQHLHNSQTIILFGKNWHVGTPNFIRQQHVHNWQTIILVVVVKNGHLGPPNFTREQHIHNWQTSILILFVKNWHVDTPNFTREQHVHNWQTSILIVKNRHLGTTGRLVSVASARANVVVAYHFSYQLGVSLFGLVSSDTSFDWNHILLLRMILVVAENGLHSSHEDFTQNWQVTAEIYVSLVKTCQHLDSAISCAVIWELIIQHDRSDKRALLTAAAEKKHLLSCLVTSVAQGDCVWPKLLLATTRNL